MDSIPDNASDKEWLYKWTPKTDVPGMSDFSEQCQFIAASLKAKAMHNDKLQTAIHQQKDELLQQQQRETDMTESAQQSAMQ
jgi:hypothetical protein